MSTSPQGPPSAPRVALRIEHDVPCPDCGYNLRGLRLDGRCPECGRATIDTFARPLRAATGVLAEEMIRRSGALLVILLAWWATAGIAGSLPPTPGLIVIILASGAAGMLLLSNLLRAARLRRQAGTRRGGSSKPLQDAASRWLLLCLLSGLAWLALLAVVLAAPAQASPLIRTGLILLASASAAGANVLAAFAAFTVLKRLALTAPAIAPVVMGLSAAGLIPAVIAPLAGGELVLGARVLLGLVALAGWLVASYRVIARLQEAQGSVVSIGKRARR